MLHFFAPSFHWDITNFSEIGKWKNTRNGKLIDNGIKFDKTNRVNIEIPGDQKEIMHWQVKKQYGLDIYWSFWTEGI